MLLLDGGWWSVVWDIERGREMEGEEGQCLTVEMEVGEGAENPAPLPMGAGSSPAGIYLAELVLVLLSCINSFSRTGSPPGL